MKKLFTLIILISITSHVFPQAGTLDTTFSLDGIALFDFTGFHETAWDMSVLEDTTILLCGTTNQSQFFVTDGFLMKVNPDGSQNMSWGINGLVIFDYGEDTYPYNMLVQADGKILVSGVVYITVSDAEFFLARFNPDGTPDQTFGVNGKFVSSYTTYEEVGECMTIQPDGKIVMAGRTYSGSFSQLLFMRINSDGTLDTGFGTNGYTEINASVQDERINGVAVLSSGTIIGVGYGYQSNPWWGEQAVITKLHSNGQPMTSFGPNGTIIPSFISDISYLNDIRVRNDSMFVAGMHYDASNNMNMIFSKLDSSAVADPGFAIGGVSQINLDPITIANDILLNTDGKLYLSGTTGLGGMNNRDFLVLRYLPNGSLDTNFNSTGWVRTDVRPDWDEAYAVDLQPDGKIVTAGMSGGLTSSGNNDIPVVRYLNDYMPYTVLAEFEADQTYICEGSTVNFSDLSLGNNTSWEWTFEGGSPSASSQQNPSVTYASAGLYDVSLIVSDGSLIDTLVKEDYIEVVVAPLAPDQPSGPTEICGSYNANYSTYSVVNAQSYDWEVVPTDAGTINGSDTTSTFQASGTWTGAYSVKVRAVGVCGPGPWSTDLNCEIKFNPTIYQLIGDGGFCNGSAGAELRLDGSDSGVDYELYLDGNTTGTIVPGTGDTISFGYVSAEGLYTAQGYTAYCSEPMIGQIFVHEEMPPAQPNVPNGPSLICNNDTSVYHVDPVTDADLYHWTIDPSDAGTLIAYSDTVEVIWNPDFGGLASLSVQAENACGLSPVSDPLSIEVFRAPNPEVDGPVNVCADEQEQYTATENAGSTYSWQVEGGSIVSGSGTHQITILWGAPGQGKVSVTEESAESCFDTSDTLDITIDECTGISDSESEGISVYPIPAKDLLTIDLSNYSGANIHEIRIINSLGLKMGSYQSLHQDKLRINTSGFNKGIYLLQMIKENKTIQTITVIKQ